MIEVGDFIYKPYSYEKGEVRTICDGIVFIRWTKSTIHDVSYYNTEYIEKNFLNKWQMRDNKIQKIINT